jgi:hypothetical protein
MSEKQFHLAQVNVARMRAPLEDPIMADFVAMLDEVNAIADAAPGFVWRFQDDTGNATYLRPFDDDRILFNMSVWESVDALKAYVYNSMHAAVLRRRREWFERFEAPATALWWVPVGRIPSVGEAKWRLEQLEIHGPTAQAFTFKQTFAPDTESETTLPAGLFLPCGAT